MSKSTIGDSCNMDPQPRGKKFTIEELINCCYLLEGINETELRDYFAKQTSDTVDVASPDKTIDYSKLYRDYLESFKNSDRDSNLLDFGIIKDILASKNIQNNFNGFEISLPNSLSKKNGPNTESEDPLTVDHLLSIANNNHMSLYYEEAESLKRLSKQFRDFVKKCRCEENLQFLIEIYNYEQLWNICFKNKRFSILKCKIPEHDHLQNKKLISTCNNTSNPQIPEVSLSKNLSVSHLFEAFLNMKDSFDVSSIVDLDMTQQIKAPLQDSLGTNWDSEFERLQRISDSSLKDSVVETYNGKNISGLPLSINAVNQDNLNDGFKNLLNESWQNIFNNYVASDSPFQINLPESVHESIYKVHFDPNVAYHSPLVLVNAKNSVVELLNENIYHPFLKELSKGELKPEIPKRAATSPSVGDNIKLGDLKKLPIKKTITTTKLKKSTTFNIAEHSASTVERPNNDTSSSLFSAHPQHGLLTNLSRSRASVTTKKSSIVSSVFSNTSKFHRWSHLGSSSSNSFNSELVYSSLLHPLSTTSGISEKALHAIKAISEDSASDEKVSYINKDLTPATQTSDPEVYKNNSSNITSMNSKHKHHKMLHNYTLHNHSHSHNKTEPVKDPNYSHPHNKHRYFIHTHYKQTGQSQSNAGKGSRLTANNLSKTYSLETSESSGDETKQPSRTISGLNPSASKNRLSGWFHLKHIKRRTRS